MTGAFDSFADDNRWVAWRNEWRKDTLTKVPYGKGGKPALANDPGTWITRAEAEALFERMPHPDGGGIGIELGPCDVDLALGGVDLDTCIVDGKLAPWAAEVIERLKSYCEISPSSGGTKVYLLYSPCPELAALLGGQDGRSFKLHTGIKHPPAIELYLGRRYFAVTGKQSHKAYPSIRLVELEDLRWLIEVAGPAFAGTAEKPQPGRDQSRSALALRKAKELRAKYPDISFERFVELLGKDDPDIASWIAEKGDERQLRRVYDKAAPDEREPDITIKRAQWEGHEFIREASGRWFDEWRNELVRNEPDAAEPFSVIPSGRPSWASASPFVSHALARWHLQEMPEPAWLIDPWLPIGQVVGLYGTPGSRKSTLLLQWMIGACLQKSFGDRYLGPGPCYGLFCEDSEFEIARRAKAMLNAYGTDFSQMADCHAESLVGIPMTELVTFSRSALVTTAFWDRFIADLDRFRPRLVCLDVIADFFGGNEISRREVGAFMRLLDALAAERKFCLVYAAHPSLRGIATRTLSSGSTGWEGKTRARLTLADPEDDPDDPVPNQSDRRILTLAKANYAKTGTTLDLVFRNGLFVPDIPADRPTYERAAEQSKAERVFLACLREFTEQNRTVSASPSARNFAPKMFAASPTSEGCSPKELDRAMGVLFHRKEISSERYGPPNKGLTKIVKVE